MDDVIEVIKQATVHGSMTYQSVPELGIEGRRRIGHRIKRLDLPDIHGKKVVDIGCNAGMFCFYAAQQGANPVFGLDKAETISGAFRVQDLLEKSGRVFKGLYFVAADLKSDNPNIGPVAGADVILHLSMMNICGIPEFLARGEHVIVECNKARWKQDAIDGLKKLGFSRVEHTGQTEDFGIRPIVKAWK